MYKPIYIDRNNLTIMGVLFPDLKTLEHTASAIGSNMYEGFNPSESSVSLIRDYVTNKITFSQFIEKVRNIKNV